MRSNRYGMVQRSGSGHLVQTATYSLDTQVAHLPRADTQLYSTVFSNPNQQQARCKLEIGVQLGEICQPVSCFTDFDMRTFVAHINLGGVQMFLEAAPASWYPMSHEPRLHTDNFSLA